jgi:ammonium transporter, Amt family
VEGTFLNSKIARLAKLSMADFAGGLVIHTNTGVAALVVSIMLKKRIKHNQLSNAYHNLPLAMIGAALIWAGWYSFNGGSAYAADKNCSVALSNTHLAASCGSLIWVFLELRSSGYQLYSILALCNGAFAGERGEWKYLDNIIEL